MKMVKSLLLGSAAGLVAVTTGQAADLPVKAKPVEYVKICSLYGAGFYYMPGTDMCIKIGGWVRAEAIWAPNGNMTWGDLAGVSNVRSTNNVAFRGRGYITADAREQTAYGTARGYIAVGISTNDTGLNTAANQFSANRAFVQFAGLTAGITQSFYDFYSGPAAAYWAGYTTDSDTGDTGWTLFGYTAQLGNGFSATVSAEERRMTQIINADPFNIAANQSAGQFLGVSGGSSIGSVGGVAPGCYQAGNNQDGYGSNSSNCTLFPGSGAYGGFQAPDIVANLRLDQSWGSVQAMGALHELNAQAYGISGTGTASMTSGHPADAWGFAAGAGLKLNFPMIAKGDYFQSQFNYTQGASRYIFQTDNTNWGEAKGNKEAFGVLSDAVYGSTTGSFTTGQQLQLTTAWGVNASYEHYWTSQWHSSLYSGYDKVNYNATANTDLCALENGTAAATPIALMATGVAGCNNNWSTWFVGSRTQWDVTKSFYLGVDVMYQDLQSANLNATNTIPTASSGGQSVGITGSTVSGGVPGSIRDEGSWMIRFRAHKDFLP
jgi:Porin subfamily